MNFPIAAYNLAFFLDEAFFFPDFLNEKKLKNNP